MPGTRAMPCSTKHAPRHELSDAQNDQITFRLEPSQPAATDELRYCVYSVLFGIASEPPTARSVSGKAEPQQSKLP